MPGAVRKWQKQLKRQWSGCRSFTQASPQKMRFNQHPQLAGGAAAGAVDTGASPELPREPLRRDQHPQVHRRTRSQEGRAGSQEHVSGYLNRRRGVTVTLLGHSVTSPRTTKSAGSSNMAWKFTVSMDSSQCTGRGHLAPCGKGLSARSAQFEPGSAPHWPTGPEPHSRPSSAKPGREDGLAGCHIHSCLVNIIIYY